MPKHLTEDTPLLRTPDMYQIENDAPITEYANETLDLIADARTSGIPDGANAFCSVGKEKRGTVQMQLFARINPATDIFEQVGFRSHGCLAAIACAAAISQMLPGKTLEEALAITRDEIEAVTGPIPKGRDYTLYFGVEAIKALVGDYLIREKQLKLEALDRIVRCERMTMECLLTENCSLRDSRVDLELGEDW
ncbi:iron-sulfur cluster assembly scaffold protein [Collinsella vaginalis]|uniref:iron-sulfur cluster assembly scaffold protein n=1 Tax=Collinsella vaginalis TaxID=1870987 RepID=UPI000A26E324|nr:iron-sulfur cluster assembly scaffold protein [Collinsella vaginalis]